MFTRIAIPLVRPALATVAVLAFLNSWNRYLEPLVYLHRTDQFTVPLTQYVTTEGGAVWQVQLAAATISIAPVLALFVLLQRYFVAGIASTGLKG